MWNPRKLNFQNLQAQAQLPINNLKHKAEQRPEMDKMMHKLNDAQAKILD